jgi:hypothetical protein
MAASTSAILGSVARIDPFERLSGLTGRDLSVALGQLSRSDLENVVPRLDPEVLHKALKLTSCPPALREEITDVRKVLVQRQERLRARNAGGFTPDGPGYSSGRRNIRGG